MTLLPVDTEVKKICGARTRQSDDQHPCKKLPIKGATRCKFHGGKTPVGIASASWKHGKYSKVLPERLLGKYEEARNDSQLLAMREELGLIDARIQDLLENVDQASGAARWQSMNNQWKEFKVYRDAGNADAMHMAIVKLGVEIESGHREHAVWGEVMQLIERRRKVVETEQKRLVQMNQVITYERAAALFTVISEVVKRHVTDRTALTAIAAEFRTISVGDER